MVSTAFCITTSKRLLFAVTCAAAMCTTMLCGTSPAQTERTVVQRIQDVSALASLDATAKPWHLKITVTVLDAKGGPPQEATVERWHAGADSRTIVSLGSETATDLEHQGQHFHLQKGPAIPQIVVDVVG